MHIVMGRGMCITNIPQSLWRPFICCHWEQLPVVVDGNAHKVCAYVITLHEKFRVSSLQADQLKTDIAC